MGPLRPEWVESGHKPNNQLRQCKGRKSCNAVAQSLSGLAPVAKLSRYSPELYPDDEIGTNPNSS